MEKSMEDSFREELLVKREADKHDKSVLLTKTEYCSLLEELKGAGSAKSETPRQYYILGRYEILQCGDVEKLIRKRNTNDDEPIYFTHIDDMFDIVKRGHISTGHGGRDRMKQFFKKYANVTRDAVELYKSLCVEC
ncbi:hypothetical protein SNE40_023410 [Patella caerulea]|uniref:Integrase zinc-binding domain-containing protein n=1 Tax=Patella caerulea TaxID=87958 RepID=A0AAN8IYN6_PATCE